LPEAAPNPDAGRPRRRPTIFAAALLLLALALVVTYTSGTAFRSPLAMVVVAAVGLAALLLQIRLRNNPGGRVHAPLWLNVLGVVCALVAVFADILRVSPAWMLIVALSAVFCFAISGIIVLDALRKQSR
jgi:drug/metabolite transporter (DMT)-like permease